MLPAGLGQVSLVLHLDLDEDRGAVTITHRNHNCVCPAGIGDVEEQFRSPLGGVLHTCLPSPAIAAMSRHQCSEAECGCVRAWVPSLASPISLTSKL